MSCWQVGMLGLSDPGSGSFNRSDVAERPTKIGCIGMCVVFST